MKMSIDIMTSLMARGYLTLQIPELDIDTFKGVSLSVDNDKHTVEMPDDWFMRLRGSLPCAGRQQGFLFLSRKGYNANKSHLKSAFEKALNKGLDRTKGKGWVAFEEHVDNHFSTMSKAIKKKLASHRTAIAELTSAIGCTKN
jgi:hypothetical protein